MEQSNQINYNAYNTPSSPAPDYNQQTHQGNVIYHHTAGTLPSYAESGSQPNFNEKPSFVPLPQQPITTYPTFMPSQPNSRDSYCDRLHRNRRPTSSIAGGLVLMIISGLHIGWGIWRTLIYGVWASFISTGLLAFTIMSWSVGAFIGGFIGSALTPILRKNFIYYLTATIMLVGNLLFIIWDEDVEAIIVGRFITGIAHGIAYVTLVTHAGENAAKNMRGTVLSILNCMFYTGIFVSVVITGTVQFTWFGFPTVLSAERILAIVSVVLAVGSMALTTMLTVETVPFLLHRNSNAHAMINLKHLRGTSHETLELRQEMEEIGLMVQQEKQISCNIFSNGNGKPLVLMTMMRLMVALTNNCLINIISIGITSLMFYERQYRIVPLTVVAPRLAMSILQIFYADFFKRKTQFIFSFSAAGFLIILIGILLNTLAVSSFGDYLAASIALGVLWQIFQFTCSIGMDQMQDVYLSEAFSPAKKPWSISFVTGVEHLFHIFMIGMTIIGIDYTAQLNATIFVTGVMIIIFGLILGVALPETRNMSLKQAKDVFINHSINIVSPFS